MTRKTRGARRSRGRLLVVTERDRDVLTFLGLVSYASADQLAREFFPSPNRARQRLRRLLDAGLVSVTLTSSTAPNLVSVTKRGQQEVLAAHPDLGRRVRLAGPIRLAGVAHHLAIVDARIFVSALMRALGHTLVAWSNAGGALHDAWGLATHRLAPDALCEVATLAAGTLRFAVEIDRGTETIGRTIATKIATYARVVRARVLDEVWFVVAAGPARRDAIREVARDNGLAEVTRVCSHAMTLVRPVASLPPSAADQPTGRRPEYGGQTPSDSRGTSGASASAPRRSLEA